MAATPLPQAGRARRGRRAIEHRRSPWFHVLMIPFTLLWIAPMVFVLVVSLRPFDDLIARGLTALPTTPCFMDYEAVYLPKNHFIKSESMKADEYTALFFPFFAPFQKNINFF